MADFPTPPMTSEAPERLLSEFPIPSLDQWREEVVRLLKGAPFEKKMLTPTYEGITLQPLYTAEDVKHLPFQDTLPGEWPYLRGTEPLGKRLQGWLVAQELPFPNAKAYNEALRHDVERGLTAVAFHLDEAGQRGLDADQAETTWVGRDGTNLSTYADALQAFEGVDASVPLLVAAAEGALPAAALLLAARKAQGVDLERAPLFLGFDPLGVLALKGRLNMSLDQAYDELADLTTWAETHAPKARTLMACGRPYHEAGANAVQELAFTLASAVATLRAMETRGIPVETAAARLHFRLGIGGHFFMEVAKFRAARVLWAQVVRACGGSDEAAKAWVFAKSGLTNKTQFDPHVNMLRATTEAFSAVVGGVDALHVGAYDEVLGQIPSELGRRIARNTQIILREESRMDQVVDLAGGSWAVEVLTHQLITAAWSLFQDVERIGGLAQALAQGFVQEKIGEVAAARRKAITARTDVLVGTNQYANPNEGLPEIQTIDHEALKRSIASRITRTGNVSGSRFANLMASAPQATLGQLTAALRRSEGPTVKPLPPFRAAEPLENLRKAVLTKRSGQVDVFLANLGPVATYMPRLDFTRGFFQVGGFRVSDQAWFTSPEEAAQAALASGAPIVVAVGPDETYVEQVPTLAKALKAGGAPIVLVAGLLKDHMEAFKAAGVDDCIHIKSDVHAVLTSLAQRLEVF